MASRREPHPTEALSPAAQLLLIAIDAKTQRIAKRRRWRFRKAMATANGTRGPGGALRAKARALRELRKAGLVQRGWRPGKYAFVPGSGASRAFGKVQRGVAGLEDLDQRLLVLLVWTGVLNGRLTRTERWHVFNRLHAMIDAPSPVESSPPGGIEPVAWAAGQIVYRQEVNLLHDLVTDLLSGNHHDVMHDLGATQWDSHAAAGPISDPSAGQQASPGT